MPSEIDNITKTKKGKARDFRMIKKCIYAAVIILIVALFFTHTYQRSRNLAISSGNYKESIYETGFNGRAIMKSDDENAAELPEKAVETSDVGSGDVNEKRSGATKDAYPLFGFEYGFVSGLLENTVNDIVRIVKERDEKEKGAPRNVKVPQDYKTIQSAIDDAQNGYIILVGAGEYEEKLVMKEGVSVIGENPMTTIIDAENSGNAIVFKNGITSKTRFSGFTVKNSGANLDGVLIEDSSPLVDGNIFSDNEYGIYIKGNSSPIIQRNIIRFNKKGIQVYNLEKQDGIRPVIADNLITDNKTGIDLYLSSVFVDHNTISYNNHYKTYLGSTYGVYLSKSSAEMANNIITDSGICDLCTGISVDVESNNVVISFNDIWNNKNDFTCFGQCTMEENNISEDPMFSDSINGDFKLKSESVLIGKGRGGSDMGIRW